MHENELFPLDTVPSRVKFAILREFKGRTPAIREVALICDRSWLAVPGIGRTALACIRQATDNQHPSRADQSPARISDSELLTRLERLQEELQRLNEVLNAALLPASKKVFRSGRMRKNALIAHGHQVSGGAF
ncbi:hypothetical protein [Microvirga soli]|jgi:hypothetical protein|uniref:hypothetical protein n=1 Tax=Microvirga soli TaxID=1854496 RepID=UPI00191ED70D|nr:hypothetical protein [Microvirga soli]